VTLQILPLAITMMVGPQIISAVILVTTPRAVRVSLMFILGVALAATFGVAVCWGLFSLLNGKVSLGSSNDHGSLGTIIQIALVCALIFAAVRTYLRRETATQPAWLHGLMDTDAKGALKTGILVILLMPSDIVIMLTVGANLAQHDATPLTALAFLAATVLVAALPLLAFLLFHERAVAAMPGLRTWMNTNSWVINIAACLIFVLLILL
jgi:hypothetical protein